MAGEAEPRDSVVCGATSIQCNPLVLPGEVRSEQVADLTRLAGDTRAMLEEHWRRADDAQFAHIYFHVFRARAREAAGAPAEAVLPAASGPSSCPRESVAASRRDLACCGVRRERDVRIAAAASIKYCKCVIWLEVVADNVLEAARAASHACSILCEELVACRQALDVLVEMI
jgi:hypothetical protein